MNTYQPIIEPTEIKYPSIWTAADGSGHKVLVENVVFDDKSQTHWIHYGWVEKGEVKFHRKTSFAFQVRYKQIPK
jgi:hypothetical protein